MTLYILKYLLESDDSASKITYLSGTATAFFGNAF